MRSETDVPNSSRARSTSTPMTELSRLEASEEIVSRDGGAELWDVSWDELVGENLRSR